MLTDDHDDAWGGDETVDIGDLKSPERKLVWVRVPPALPLKTNQLCNETVLTSTILIG
jgi:hypothetical protein